MKKTTAILYKIDKNDIKNGIANLEIVHLEPENGKKFELKEVQKAVGGYIEQAGYVTIENRIYMILVDEEGKLKNLPVNHGFWWNYGTPLQPEKNKFVGNVLLIPEGKFE
jgi:hypothetical protein